MTPDEYETLNRFGPTWASDESDDYDDQDDEEVDSEEESSGFELQHLPIGA